MQLTAHAEWNLREIITRYGHFSYALLEGSVLRISNVLFIIPSPHN